MSAPYEIVSAPFTIYLAPTGTAFPAIDATPSGSWTKLGTSGTKNYNEDGVEVNHPQNLETFRPVGSTANRKVWRTEEDFTVGFTLHDLSPDQYAKVLNNITVTTVAQGSGIAGQKHFPLLRGGAVALFALVAKGMSTVDDNLTAQFEVPIVYQNAEPNPVFKKGDPAGLELEFAALEDDTIGFGKLRIQTLVAL